MKLHRSAATLIMALALLQLASCSKKDIIDSERSTQTLSDDATADVDLSSCKIRRIYQQYPVLSGSVTALFSYNKAGNPVSLLYPDNGTGLPDHYFIYDSKNRLKEWRKTYSLGTFIVEHHIYTHDALNRIVSDHGIYREAGGHYETVSTIEYDSKGRVIKETIVNTYADGNPLEPTRRPTYTYDNRGNIGVIGWKSSSYDNKINPLRQSPVFQFVMRNYSMNNAAVQARYNSRGLPLSMNPSNDAFFNSMTTTKVIYDCQ